MSILRIFNQHWYKFIKNYKPDAEIRKLFDTYDSLTKKAFFFQHYSATCQQCEKYKVHFILSSESSKPIPLNPHSAQYKELKQFVKKIGQYPPYAITPDKEILRFLNEEDKEYYKNALMCLSQNYGIGAHAYLRRIVENEIERIIEALAQIDSPEKENINNLLNEYRQKHVMEKLIDGIYDYLPNSLKESGDNPFKLLHNQLSGGIHEFSDDKCSDMAQQIDIILRFVIKKINEENSEVKEVRKAMQKLRNRE